MMRAKRFMGGAADRAMVASGCPMTVGKTEVMSAMYGTALPPLRPQMSIASITRGQLRMVAS